MKSAWFPHDYPLETAFPDRELVWKGGMESVYEVTHEGKPSLLYDGRFLLGFAGIFSLPDDVSTEEWSNEELQGYLSKFAAEMGDKFVELIVFDTIEERAAYLASKYPPTKFSKHMMELHNKRSPE